MLVESRVEADVYEASRTDDIYIRLVDRSGWEMDPREAKKGFVMKITQELFSSLMQEVAEGEEFPQVRLTSNSTIERIDTNE